MLASVRLGMYLFPRDSGISFLSSVFLRIITHQNWQVLVNALQAQNVGITIMDGHGAKGPVKIIFTIIKRKDIDLVRDIIREFNPNAFYSIEDIRVANQGVFPKKSAVNNTMDYIRSVFPDPKEK